MTPNASDLLILLGSLLVGAGLVLVAEARRRGLAELRGYRAAIARHRRDSRTRPRVDVDLDLWRAVDPELARHTSDHYALAGSPCGRPDAGFCAVLALRELARAGACEAPAPCPGCGPSYHPCYAPTPVDPSRPAPAQEQRSDVAQ